MLKFILPLTVFIATMFLRENRRIAQVSLGAFLLLGAGLVCLRIFWCRTFESKGKSDLVLEASVETNLRSNIQTLAKYKPAHVYGQYATNLAKAAEIIATKFEVMGYTNKSFPFRVIIGQPTNLQVDCWVTNIVAEKVGTNASLPILIVGAHYDTMTHSDEWEGVKHKA